MVKGNLDHLRARQNVGVHAYTSGSQTITATAFGSGDTVTFTEVDDYGSDYVSNTFTAPVKALYMVDFTGRAESDTSAQLAQFCPYLACSTLGDQPFLPADGSSHIDVGSYQVPYMNVTGPDEDPTFFRVTALVPLDASETMSVEAIYAGNDVVLTEKRLVIALASAA